MQDDRTLRELQEHYDIERALAAQLRRAPPLERRSLYISLYDELFRRVPRHPAHQRQRDRHEIAQAVAEKRAFLDRFLTPETRFLEIGAGNASVSLDVASTAKHVWAVDVVRQIPEGTTLPDNFDLIVLEDGCSLPLPDGCAHLAYSNQLIEHLHPEDAERHLREVYRVLAPGGCFVCITPNRVSGPHDVSRSFASVADGLHLKEYRAKELARTFGGVGFSKTTAFVGLKHRYTEIPLAAIHSCEQALSWLPDRPRKSIAAMRGVRNLLFLSLVATK